MLSMISKKYLLSVSCQCCVYMFAQNYAKIRILRFEYILLFRISIQPASMLLIHYFVIVSSVLLFVKFVNVYFVSAAVIYEILADRSCWRYDNFSQNIFVSSIDTFFKHHVNCFTAYCVSFKKNNKYLCFRNFGLSGTIWNLSIIF